MLPFHEVLFPVEISYGSSGGPKFKTTVFTADSGYEQRNVDWRNVRCEFDCSHGVKSREQMEDLTRFFMARRGRAYGFRFKDFSDFQIRQQVIAETDGVTQQFQIIKTYRSYQAESGSDTTYSRTIKKIAWDTVAGVTIGGVVVASEDYEVDHDTGIITFNYVPPGTFNSAGEADGLEVKIGYAEFHVPCRFDTDHLDVQHDFWETMSWPNIPILEDRNFAEVLA